MIKLTGDSLTIEKMKRICFDLERVCISEESIQKVQQSREAVEKIIREDRTIYGINTGFGKFSDVIINEKNVQDLQLNLIRSHACGVGKPFSEEISRAIMVLRLNALVKGYSGVRVELIQTLQALINHSIHPVIPEKGSLGTSGDLAPLAHLALVLIGEGYVHGKNGEHLQAAD